MGLYRIYGLTVDSDFGLESLPRCDGPADVIIRRASLAHIPRDGATVNRLFYAGYLLSPDTGLVVIRNGSEILLDLNRSLDPGYMQRILVGSLMSVVLMQRGLITLHGSSVVISGEAVGFLGRSGAGKSTLAGLLSSRGHQFLCDDLMAIAPGATGSSRFEVVPAYPRLKLLPDSAHCLGFLEVEDPSDDYLKRFFFLRQRFSEAHQPLGKLFFLETGEQPEIRRLSPVESFIKLISHSRAFSAFEQAEVLSYHFKGCEQLVQHVPMFALVRTCMLQDVDQMIAMIEAHAQVAVERTCS